MIRNAVLHINNEQPLLADLYDMPTALDVSLVCTNVRLLDGKKPVFIDHVDSVFVFPYLNLRFIELPGATVAPTGATTEDAVIAAEAPPEELDGDADLELDEDFLRRIRDV